MQLDQIGKYKIVGKIGQGAMGEVFKAHDAVLNRMVAIKTINADLGTDETLRKRFQREAQSAARLNHPNIITVYDYGEEHNKIYMAMELLEGIDLKQTIVQRAPLSLDEKLEIMDQICDGLAFAHAGDIVHRDLKPANIHLLANGQVKIMDFGLARLGGSEMTRTGMVMGTPHYMSPEQVRGERADSRSDIFSLGCVFYELLTYRKPFDADSMHAVLFKVMQEEPEPVTHVVPDLPHVLQDLLDRDAGQGPQPAAAERGRAARRAAAGTRGHRRRPRRRPAARVAGRGSAGGAATAGRAGAGPETRRPIARGDRTSTAARARARTTTPRPAAVAPPPPVRWPLYVGGLAALALAIGGGLFVLSRMTGTSTATPPPTAPQARRRWTGWRRSWSGARSSSPAAGSTPATIAARPGRRSARSSSIPPTRRRRTSSPARAASSRRRTARRPPRGPPPPPAIRRARRGACGSCWSPTPAIPRWTSWLLRTRGRSSLAPTRPGGCSRDAQSAAEKAGASNLDVFREAAESARAGEAAYKAGRFATAARKLLEARDRFARAARIVR